MATRSLPRNILNILFELIFFTMQVFDPPPSQYIIKVISDRWLGVDALAVVPLADVAFPDASPPHSPLLRLTPLPRRALQCAEFESMYRFSHFNPIQTQVRGRGGGGIVGAVGKANLFKMTLSLKNNFFPFIYHS
jgi:hypothetical protein